MLKLATNFDHTWDGDVARRLQEDPDLRADYPAWNFYAVVRWDAEAMRWEAELWHHGRIADVITAQTVPGLMRTASDTYGAG